MKRIFILLLVLAFDGLLAQPNCELLKEDEACYSGCKTAWKAIRYSQGSYQSQVLFDEAILECSTFAYSYMQKAVPFLKRGHFVEWKKLIDKAVDLAPEEYLGYRGWCRVQFLRDYRGGIEDIEELKRITNYDIGFCQNGNYHLEIALALFYKEIGELDKAKSIMESHMALPNYSPDLFDYYHLGVIEYQLGNYQRAEEVLKKQLEINALSEVHFYLALTNKELDQKDLYQTNLEKSEQLYLKKQSILDNYAEPIDKIYLLDILDEKASGFTK